ncbi:hypothetical protein ZWY2020_040790 [Hordeum vulgare]|nr:hypothetical protein ZWY2020_040790 [Hordeum vulgare]
MGAVRRGLLLDQWHGIQEDKEVQPIDVECGVGANPKIRWLPRCSSLAELAVSNGFTVTKTQVSKPRRSTGDEASPSLEFQHEYSIAIPSHSYR